MRITLVAIFVFLVVFFSYRFGLFYGLEVFFEDILFQEKPIDEKILILSIDNESISKIGQWPWPRKVFADALVKLNDSEPSAVGLDVIMSEPSRLGEKDDAYLVKAINGINYPLVLPIEGGNISINKNDQILASDFLKPLPVFSESENVVLGHVNLISDRDSVVRNIPMFIDGVEGETYGGLAYETVKNSNPSVIDDKKYNSSERIVFVGPRGSVRQISFWRLINDEINPESIAGKIIFIGATATDLHDEKPTPFGKGTQMSGVEIHANIANMFLKGYRIVPLSEFALLFWIFVASMVPPIIFYFSGSALLAILLNCVVGFIYILAIIILFENGFSANFVHISLSWILSTSFSFLLRYFTVDKEKREMRGAFSKYVSKDVLHEILRNPSKIKLGGEEREVTVFFSDVRSFTTLSEGMTPSQLTNFLNKYLSRMTNIILEKKGVVDKYIGDAIMAFWGAPVDNDDQALDAIISSLQMIDSLGEFNEENKLENSPEIDIGIGLNTGKVTVGNMGSEVRFDYTVMGDTVNLASRLEGQTKNYGVKIIISESTKDKLRAENIKKHNLHIREIDRIKVKGKNLPVTIFEVVPRDKEGTFRALIDDFNTLRGIYYEGKWSEGILLADSILKRCNDGPTKVFKERCLYFMEHQPVNWAGVYEMKSK